MDTTEIIKQALVKAGEHCKCGDYVNAEELYRQILRVDPDNVEALERGALAISQNGKTAEAVGWVSRVANPGYETYNNMGLLYAADGRREDAIGCFRRAIGVSDEPYLKINLAIELNRAGQRDEALRVMDTMPQTSEVLFNYGAILHEAGEVSRAIDLYRRALQIRPGYAVCHYNLSACWFLLGEYGRAWPEYEWRWHVFPRFAVMRKRFSAPYWRGEDLAGKTIVLYNEQGYGDLIMSAQFFGELGGTVVLECPAEMIDLMKPHVDLACVRYDGLADYHCSVMSVPGVLGVGPDHKAAKYLSSVGITDGDWGRYPGKRVGVCWTGNPRHPNDRNRSCEALRFSGLDGTLFSFQKDVRPHAYPGGVVVDWAGGCRMVDLCEHMTDFNRTAKLLEQMDEVVTVDSCVAHLSGAVGVPTKLLLCKVPDWRWGLVGDSTHWYGSVKLYRQERAGEWDSVFKDLMSV